MIKKSLHKAIVAHGMTGGFSSFVPSRSHTFKLLIEQSNLTKVKVKMEKVSYQKVYIT